MKPRTICIFGNEAVGPARDIDLNINENMWLARQARKTRTGRQRDRVGRRDKQKQTGSTQRTRQTTDIVDITKPRNLLRRPFKAFEPELSVRC